MIKMKEIPLMNIKRQFETFSSEYEESVLQVLKSGNYIGGEVVEEFENKFANYCSCKYAISCANGTDALIIALRAIGIGKGDEVITTSLSFFATSEAISSLGAIPVFIDIDPITYCIDTNLIRKKISINTKAILPVHIYGCPCNMNEINKIAKEYNLKIIEDCAQAIGTLYNGSKVGSLSDIGCFSFFPTKTLGCAGDGGCIVTNNYEYAETCRALRVHGSGKNGFNTLKRDCTKLGKNFLNEIEFVDDKYHNYIIGYNSRLDAVQAALLNVKIEKLESFIADRRKHANVYRELLKGTNYIMPFEDATIRHSYYIFVLQHSNAEEIMKKLRESGIGCGVYYPVPLHLEPVYNLSNKSNTLPVVEKFVKSSFAIPIYPELTDEEQDYIIKKLIEFDKLY